MIENIQHEYFIWEEKNLTDLNQNSLKNEKSVKESSIIETKNDSIKKDWRDITDPKLRKKARNKDWRDSNRDKIKAYNDSNKDKQKAYYKVNKDKIKVKTKDYQEDNKDKIKAYQKAYHQDNKYKLKIQMKAYYKVNKDKIKVQRKAYTNNRFKTDIQYKLSHNLRVRLYRALKDNYKIGSAVKDLGCTIQQLKQHLESKFQPGMSWDNHTLDGWHIDHIKPLSSFDLSDRKQLLEACHYTNLQPLWAKDNLSKSDNFI